MHTRAAARALLALAAAAVLSTNALAATLRIVSYNIDDDTGSNGGGTQPNTDMDKLSVILQAMGVHQLGTTSHAQPVDVLALQELHYNNPSISSSLPAIVSQLNAVYGAGTYAYDTRVGATNANATGNGPNGLIYNTHTVMDLGSFGLTVQADGTTPLVSSSAAPRQPLRYLLRPVGYASDANFYLYDSHYKSDSTATDKNRRAIEAAAIRHDADVLGDGKHIIYAGDFNLTGTSSEAAWQTLIGAGFGQANDPMNALTWSNDIANKRLLTETASRIATRDDFQLVTSEMLNQPGMQLVPSSYEIFGNNNSITYHGSVTDLSNTALSDVSNRAIVLSDMADGSVTDHLPIVADYQTVGVNLATIWLGASGTWSTPSQWNTGVVPNSSTLHVLIDDGNNTASPVTLNQDATVGDLRIDFGDSLVVSGTRTLTFAGPATSTLNGAITNSGTISLSTGATARLLAGGVHSGAFSVAAGATLEFGGGTHRLQSTSTLDGAGNINVTGGTVTFAGTMSYTGPTAITAGTVILKSNLLTTQSLSITGGTLQAVGVDGGDRLIKSASVSVSGAGKLDLLDNKLITQTAIGAWNGSNYTGVTGMIRAGRNSGSWDGNGILTTIPDAATPAFQTTLAIATAQQAGKTTFAGVSVAPTDVLVMYTWSGDANLSGHVDADDYFQIDSHYNKTDDASQSYFNGDFNYDGKINGDDYFLIDNGFINQGSSFSLGALPAGFLTSASPVQAVPEPAAVGLIVLALGGTLRRRR